MLNNHIIYLMSRKRMFRLGFVLASLMLFASAQDVNKKESTSKTLVYVFDIKEQIAPPVWRTTQKSFEEATRLGADLIIIHLNTYGGMVNTADSIRTKILNSKIPVWVFIDNQAISAGALVCIACDRIYMRQGANIGAATVVDQSGQQVPDKYQSFMRSTMRSTAESHGKDTIIVGNDTTFVWHRDPRIAEAMVDPRVHVPGISDSGQVLTMTAEEAIRFDYCEGIVASIPEVLEQAGIEEYEIKKYEPSGLDKVINFLLNPMVHGLLIMVVIGGIYFELQTPGIGFPLIAAVIAAMLYFAPLYLEGLAENWEILLFIAGLVLVGLELFVIPGFGIAGIAGIVLVVAGLTLSMIDNVVFESPNTSGVNVLLRALFIVIGSGFLSFILSIYISQKLFTSHVFGDLALFTTQEKEKGYESVDVTYKTLVGKEGIAQTRLMPSGKILVDDEIYEGQSLMGYIDKGEKIKIVKLETGTFHVIKV